MTCSLGMCIILCAPGPMKFMLCAVMGGRRSVAACAACALLLLVAVSADQTATQGTSQPSTTLTTMAQQVAQYNGNTASLQTAPAAAASVPRSTTQLQSQAQVSVS